MQTQTIYYVGQDVGLTASPLDDAGSPITGSVSASVTVTDPTGTVTSPVVSAAGSGAYSAIVPSVVTPGVWLVRWTATGTNSGTPVTWAYESQFTVRPLGLEQIVDLISVKKHLNLNLNDTRQDEELTGFIMTASDQARDVVGPFLPEQHTEYFDGGGFRIVPDWLPIASVQSITEYYGLSAFLLTEQPLGTQMNAFAFTVDYTTGEITRRTFGGQAAMFAIGAKNVKVVYTAGLGQIPFTVRLGALELIRHLWQQTQQGGRPKFGGAGLDGDAVGTPMGFALPDRVIELWSPKRRPPGIA